MKVKVQVPLTFQEVEEDRVVIVGWDCNKSR